jgi:hypothetical protein
MVPSLPVSHRSPASRALRYALLALAVFSSAATTVRAQYAYHFSPTGDDTLGDGSASDPWATLDRAASLDLQPGDSLRFEGGATFVGGLYLDADDGGRADLPVVVTSYGQGRATIEAGDGFGIFAYNAGGVEVRDLVVAGAGSASNENDGIAFYADLPGDTTLAHLRVANVDVSGFGKAGLSIGAWNGETGWRDVRVTDSDFHGNADGMITFAAQKGALKDIYVGQCRFYENPGRSGFNRPSGSGLVLGGVDGALVERSVAYGNGAHNTHHAGPVGIWAYDANAVVIQHNEAYGNRTGVRSGSGDGGGFDLDGGVTNSVLQYNYSHDNDGAGFGLFQYAGAPPSGGNTVRFNLSENDGRANGYGAISVWGASSGDRVGSTAIYHNTIYVRASEHGAPSAINIKNQHHRGLSFRNNVLVTSDGVRLVRGPASPHARFEGNAYWAGDSLFTIAWGGTTYGDLTSWRDASGQERLPDALGGETTGVEGEPMLEALGAGGTAADPDSLEALTAYRLQPNSPLVRAGLDLGGLFELDSGPHDFFGTPLSEAAAPSIGAHQPMPEEPVLISGPIEVVDAETRSLIISEMSVIVPPEAVIRTAEGEALRFDDIHAGMIAEAEGSLVAPETIEATGVVVEGAATPLEASAAGLPTAFDLVSAFPNPTAARATLLLDLPEGAAVAVSVHDMLGREVLDLPPERVEAGRGQALPLHLKGLASGVYIVRVTASGAGATAAASTRVTVID